MKASALLLASILVAGASSAMAEDKVNNQSSASTQQGQVQGAIQTQGQSQDQDQLQDQNEENSESSSMDNFSGSDFEMNFHPGDRGGGWNRGGHSGPGRGGDWGRGGDHRGGGWDRRGHDRRGGDWGRGGHSGPGRGGDWGRGGGDHRGGGWDRGRGRYYPPSYPPYYPPSYPPSNPSRYYYACYLTIDGYNYNGTGYTEYEASQNAMSNCSYYLGSYAYRCQYGSMSCNIYYR